MVTVTTVYDGELRVTATHDPSGARMVTDAPRDNEGLGRSFSPTDLIPAALGACMLTVMGIVARRRAWPLDGASIQVEKHMVADPARRIGRLVVRVRMPDALPAEARAALERAALACPVHKSLHPDIEIPVEFSYGP